MMFTVNIRTTPITAKEIDSFMLTREGNPEEIIGYLRAIIRQYAEAKIEMVVCKQRHFLQLCPRCWEYAKCKKYAWYVETWTKLQEILK